MQKEIVAAVVGAAGTVIGAALPKAWDAFMKYRVNYLSARRDALLGRWVGKASDYYIEDKRKSLVTFDAVMNVMAVGRTVRAEGVLSGFGSGTTREEEDQIALIGMFYNNDYLQLSYYSKNFARKQLGVVVLALSSDGSNLRGYYTGFSPRRETIVAGTIQFRRRNC